MTAARAEMHEAQPWLQQRLAALSPEQREQLRDQIREHRQQQREERREMRNDDAARGGSNGGPNGGPNWRQEQRPPPGQRLAPENREEFRQWMRERHERREGNR